MFSLVIGGLVVSVLVTGTKVCGFKPASGEWTLRAIKIHSMPSFRGEVKLLAPCHKILHHVKEPFKA
jgi:hypothetical protein